MTIARVWPHGTASMPPAPTTGEPMLTFSDAASLDGNLQKCVDKQSAGGIIAGTLTLGAGGVLSLDDPSASLILSGANAETASGGRIRCGDGDYPTFSAPRTRTVLTSLLETFPDAGGSHAVPGAGGFSLQRLPGNAGIPAGVSPTFDWYVDNSTGALQPGSQAAGAANAFLLQPLTRIHDGASSVSIAIYFTVDAGRTTLPTRYPAIGIYRQDPYLRTFVLSGGAYAYFPAPANVAAYINGGVPNVLSVSFVEAIDLSKYLYYAALLDEDYAGVDTGLPNKFSALSHTTTANDLRSQ